MLLTFAVIVVAMLALATVELWLFWRLGERDDQRRAGSLSGAISRRRRVSAPRRVRRRSDGARRVPSFGLARAAGRRRRDTSAGASDHVRAGVPYPFNSDPTPRRSRHVKPASMTAPRTQSAAPVAFTDAAPRPRDARPGSKYGPRASRSKHRDHVAGEARVAPVAQLGDDPHSWNRHC
jgi:hypothetical protein